MQKAAAQRRGWRGEQNGALASGAGGEDGVAEVDEAVAGGVPAGAHGPVGEEDAGEVAVGVGPDEGAGGAAVAECGGGGEVAGFGAAFGAFDGPAEAPG